MARDWHPILAAKEYEPGRWVIFDGMDKPYALIDLVKRGGELGYRATTWNAEKTEGVVIGYYRSVAGACARVHHEYHQRPKGAPNARQVITDPWGREHR